MTRTRQTVCCALLLSAMVFASPVLSNAAPKDTKKAEALYKQGAKLGMNMKLAEAVGMFQKATEADPTYAPAYNGWGLALSNMGKEPAAIEKYKKAVELDPKLAKAYYNWGLTLNKIGKDKEAVEKLRTAARLDPTRSGEINDLVVKIQNQVKLQRKGKTGTVSPHHK